MLIGVNKRCFQSRALRALIYYLCYKRLRVVSNKMLLKTVIPLKTKEKSRFKLQIPRGWESDMGRMNCMRRWRIHGDNIVSLLHGIALIVLYVQQS